MEIAKYIGWTALVCAVWALLTAPVTAQTVLYSGARALTCYQGGTKILERAPIFSLRESRTEDRVTYSFREKGLNGPKQDFTVTGDDTACVVEDYDTLAGDLTAVPGQHVMTCIKNGVVVVPQSRIHGLTFRAGRDSTVYRFVLIDRPAPPVSVEIANGEGACVYQPL